MKTEKLQQVEVAAHELKDLFSVAQDYIPRGAREQLQHLLGQLEWNRSDQSKVMIKGNESKVMSRVYVTKCSFDVN